MPPGCSKEGTSWALNSNRDLKGTIPGALSGLAKKGFRVVFSALGLFEDKGFGVQGAEN